MTLTAREALQALLDGKTLRDREDRYWRMDDEGELQTKWEMEDDWICSEAIWNGDCRIQEEYPLIFMDALKAMLDGKTVESGNSKRKYFLASADVGVFAEMKEDTPSRTFVTEMKLTEQIGRWKVIE